MSLKRILRVLAVMLLAVGLLSAIACKDTKEPDTPPATEENGKATYTINVTDYQGNVPSYDVLVEVQKNGVTVGMKKADATGKATFELEKGDYTFIPTAAKAEVHYDAEACQLTADVTEVTVVLYSLSGGKQTIYPYFASVGDRMAYEAAQVTEGATYVEMDRDDMSYYIFAPTRGGIYRISYISDTELSLGYYGDANVVLSESTADVENHAFEIEIQDGSVGNEEAGGTFRMVIGLGSATAKNAILVIERIADPVPELEWTDCVATQVPTTWPKTDYLNHALVDISITDPSVKIVYSAEDGYYHYGSADGPVVYVRISSPSKYLVSFTEICETTRMYKLFYENGELVKKESYNNIVAAYANICDSNGVCPLTEELIYMINNSGEQMGWWDIDAEGKGVLTADQNGNPTGVTAANLVKNNAYLFACCYVDEFAHGGDTAITLTPSGELATARVIAKAGEPVKFRATGDVTVFIENAEGMSVTCNGKTYLPYDDGVIAVSIIDKATFTVTSETAREFIMTYEAFVEE